MLQSTIDIPSPYPCLLSTEHMNTSIGLLCNSFKGTLPWWISEKVACKVNLLTRILSHTYLSSGLTMESEQSSQLFLRGSSWSIYLIAKDQNWSTCHLVICQQTLRNRDVRSFNFYIIVWSALQCLLVNYTAKLTSNSSFDSWYLSLSNASTINTIASTAGK